MGLFEWFGGGQLSEKKIARIAKLAANPYAQPDVRMREMHRLLGEGSPLALRGVLKRFAANASGAIADEDEKGFLEDAIVEQGDDAIEPLRDYIRGETQLSYALRAYKRITGAPEAVRYVIEVLRRYGPDNYRAADAKLQLVWQLAEDLDQPEVLPALTEFLDDHSDDIRWAVIDLLERAADENLLSPEATASACGRLGSMVTGEGSSQRILVRAAQVLCQRQWSIPGDQEALVPSLDSEYFLDKKRFIRRRQNPKA